MNLESKKRLTDLENQLIVAGGKGGGTDSWGVWDAHVHAADLKWMINKDLRYSTGNSAQGYVAAWMGGELGENGYVYM